ncbi:MAG TPA: hypothetical protein VIJ59_01095 [Caulobacteraceae bacterium]
MAVAQQSKPKWVDPDSMWDDDDEPKVVEMRPEMNIDRFHNHEDMSSEAMAKAISDLQATVVALDGRLSGIEGSAAGGAHAAKDLGVSMVKMGDALSKRMKLLEDSAAAAAEAEAEARAKAEAEAEVAEPATVEEASLFAPIIKPKGKEKTLVLTVGLGAVILAAIAGLVLLHPQPSASRVTPPAQVLYSPSAPAPN